MKERPLPPSAASITPGVGITLGNHVCMTSIPDSASDVIAQLKNAVRGAVSGGLRRRAEYSSDAGNYRLLPTVVVEPLDVDDVLATLAVSRATGVPVTSRGAGTSIAGNAIGTGIVIDFARHLNRVLEVDAGSRTALVEPGVVMSAPAAAGRPLGLRFGPDPSTQNRATLGGMIGNNACGPHAVAYGRTADNVAALTMVDGVGRRISTADGAQQMSGPGRRWSMPGSRSSGPNSAPSAGRSPATRWSTCCRRTAGTWRRRWSAPRARSASSSDATVKLVRISPARMLVVLGYPDMAAAADAVPALLAHAPLAIEGLDARLVDVVRAAKGAAAVPDLPRGAGWLMIEVGGETLDAAQAPARRWSGTRARWTR